MAERFGVVGRGKFYEETGTIRDVVQNHLLQMIACIAMEAPRDTRLNARRDVRSELLKKIRTLNPEDIIRGQFDGYKNEPGVSQNSQVETFAAVRFSIDNERWAGVPFYVRAGKCLPVTATEVIVRFKPSIHNVFDVDERGCYCRFRVSPEVTLALGTRVKKPGETMCGESIELVANHQPADEMSPYERLLSDAINGDGTLFAREDSVEAAWRIVDPVLGNTTSLQNYAQNTWGPTEASPNVTPAGGWHVVGTSESNRPS